MKLTAASIATMTNIAYTAARSLGRPSTLMSTNGTFPAATLRFVHMKNSWTNTTPTTMNTGAGERPARVNGAPSSARTMPQSLRLLNPIVSSTTARPISTEATRSIRIDGFPLSDFRVKVSAKTMTARPRVMMKIGRHPTKVPRVPPMRKALIPEKARADPREPTAAACCAPR